MTGRKPQPTALKVLRGNPGRRELNLDQPAPAPLEAEPMPAELQDETAQREWRRLVPGLIACGQVSHADRTLLIAYCQKWGQWLRLEDEVLRRPLSEDPALTFKAIRMANQTLEILLRTAAELGLTPSSRSRVTRVTPAAVVSKWAGALP